MPSYLTLVKIRKNIIKTNTLIYCLDIIDSDFPYNHRPGTNLISKLILTDTQVIIALLKTLVPEAAKDSYASVPTEFITGGKCNVLYAPPNPLWKKYLFYAIASAKS